MYVARLDSSKHVRLMFSKVEVGLHYIYGFSSYTEYYAAS